MNTFFGLRSATEWTKDDRPKSDLWNVVCESCTKYAKNVAYADSTGPVTYGEVLQKVRCLSASLLRVLQAHEKGALSFKLLLPNCSTHVDLFFAAAAVRAKVVCVNHRLKIEELQVLFERGHSPLLIASDTFASLLSKVEWATVKVRAIAWVNLIPEDFRDPHIEQMSLRDLYGGDGSFKAPPFQEDMWVQGFFTSGTTGVPKSVSHTHKNVYHHSLSTIKALNLQHDNDDCWGHFGPLFHCGTPAFIWISVMLGARQVFHENQFQFMDVAQMMNDDKVTIVKLMPTILKYLLSAEKTRSMKFEKLKWVLTGGMKPTLDVIEQTKEVFGCEFIQGYGMTEATVHCSFKNESKEPAEHGMTVLPGLDLRILDERDEEAAADTAGEICIRGPTVFAGYDNNPDANKQAFTASGFFRSGDLGYLNEKGQLFISGRSKDMIIVGGENVFSVEVEQVINRVPGILRCAVFGGPDEALGEVVHCAVVLAGSQISAEEMEQKICRKCAESLAPYKVPVGVHIWPEDDFPMTGSGKPVKYEIRERCLNQVQEAKHFVSKEAAVIGAVASVLGRDIKEEDYHTAFMDLNMASMEFTRVMNLLSGTLAGGELSPTLLFENDTLAELLRYIESRTDLVLVNEVEEQKLELAAIAGVNDRKSHRWRQWSPLGFFLQLLLLLVRPVVLTVPVLFAAWAGWLWWANHYGCGNCYWTLIFLPLIWPLSIILLMVFVVVMKWLVIGRSVPGTIKLFSPQYYQWLCIYNLFQAIDPFLALFRGTSVLIFFYNRCGAHISYSAEIHSSNLTDLDLLRIRTGSTVDRACNIQPSHITTENDGWVILGKVTIDKDCFVGYGATVGPHVSLPMGSHLRPLQAVSVAQPVRSSVSHAKSKKSSSHLWLAALQGCLLYYVLGGFVCLSVTAGVAVMHVLPTEQAIVGLMLPRAWTEGLTGSTLETSDMDLLFWVVLPLVVFFVVPQAYFICVVLAKYLIVGFASAHTPKTSRAWKLWFYCALIDCPLFRLATQLTIMSHLTKLQFQVLGCKIGKRAYFCAPFVPDPELVEIGDNVILAGNVALLTTAMDEQQCNKIVLKSRAIVANTVVLKPGCCVEEASIVGDGVSIPADQVLPTGMVAMRDNSDALAYILMKRSSVPNQVEIGCWVYAVNQVILLLLQLILNVGAHIPGYLCAGLIVTEARSFMSREVGTWPFIPVLMLVTMTSKILLIPVFKWAIACRFRPSEIRLFGLRYAIWIAFEAVLFDADQLFLQTLCGTVFLSGWYRLMGAKIGWNVCLMGSSVGCEYDLKHIESGTVVNHASLLFSHSVEKGTLIFRRSYLEASSELGFNCVAEAGARIRAGTLLLPCQVAHNTEEDVSNKPKKFAMQRSYSNTFRGGSPGQAEVSDTLQKGYLAVRNRRQGERAKGILGAFSTIEEEPPPLKRSRASYRTQEAIAKQTGRVHEVCMNLDDFEQQARQAIQTACYGYYQGGATDEWTLKENRYAFERYRIIPRVLVPVSTVDLRCSFFGINCRFPVMIAPSAMHGQAHEEAEKATARAAVRAGSAFTLSSLSTMSMEDVAGAVPMDDQHMPKGLMFQLYVFKRRDITELIVKKAERLGYKALCLTVDAPCTGRRERDIRSGFAVSDAMGQLPNIQMLGHVVNQQLVEFEAQKDLTLDWGIIRWLKSICNLPVIAKGVLHPLDARCAIEAGADAIVVSNHGGRQLDSTPATIDVLPWIAEEVKGQIPIFIDGGIRRGTDVFKALGLGASAVMFARPAVYALAVGGEQGVSRMLRLLYDELETTMRLAGCTSLSEIPSRILRPTAERFGASASAV
ncbi:unnamed protein product [Effrenium voratum]|uniref:(S)-2-hydroxy-acid oxidase n=1 Tax=Effrenium voratum TaxID=2562239 RepID=A0AA36MKD7_9DINO|nr:unnamed protein product [Effrenium voratum]